MTHGEEPDPKTHQDSAVLTYLEGLLMHPVAAGPATTATRGFEAGNNNAEPGKHGAAGVQLSDHTSCPPEKGAFSGAASQHFKKVRLLRSGAWTEDDKQNKVDHVAGLHLQNGELRNADTDTSTQGKSTLLASLLQSFNSHLETVAISQNSPRSLQKQNGKRSEGTSTGDITSQEYASASNHLKGLIRKNKQQSHKNVPYSCRGSQERCSESPHFSKGSDSAVSCAERLKVVASLVKNRSSPAPSPKPSIACSQLALLLSSEAHLQQYSKEQNLKAQLSGRSASERLTAMATQQTKEKELASVVTSISSQDVLLPFSLQNETLLAPTLNTNNRSSSQSFGQSVITSSPQPAPHYPKERRAFDRHSNRPPPNCSSLLLLLLNNHNTHVSARNGYQENDCTVDSSQASSHQSDSEYSNQENNLPKDSSDAESCYSSCSPIDLSIRSRVYSQKSEPPSLVLSLDKLTETLLDSWKPDTPGPKIPKFSDLETSPDCKSHRKVTLMQLLLDRKNNERINNVTDHLDLHHNTSVTECSGELVEKRGSRIENTLKQLINGGGSTSFLSGAQSESPYHPYSPPVIQSSPLDLCKPKRKTSELITESTFTASKLLQNLAQCGVHNQSPSPSLKICRPLSKKQSPEPKFKRQQTFLDRPVALGTQTQTSMLQSPPLLFTTFTENRSHSKSAQIENLLERRNVLQHLLGNAYQKEKSGGRRSTEFAIGDHIESLLAPDSCVSSNGTLLNVKIKTEPSEESPLSEGFPQILGCVNHDHLTKANCKMKEEQYSTDVVHKYGLLSQLLKQKTNTYHSGPSPEPLMSTVSEDLQNDQVPLPKKRKVCLELAEHLSKELCQRPSDTVNERLISTPLDLHNNRALLSPKEEESFTTSHGSKPSSGDSHGFNVLKQLLLSDNCLKELPRPQGIASPVLPQASNKANGKLSQLTYNKESVSMSWFSPNLGPDHLKPLLSLPENSSQALSWARSSLQPCSKSVKTENSTWTPVREGKCEASSDSPPLTRSNPILYYMLQKSSELRKELDYRAQRTQCGVKVEPCTDEPFHSSCQIVGSDSWGHGSTNDVQLEEFIRLSKNVSE